MQISEHLYPVELTAAIKTYNTAAFKIIWTKEHITWSLEKKQTFLYDLLEKYFSFSKQPEMLIMLEEIFQTGFELNYEFDNVAQTPLCLAISVSSRAVVELMLKYGARINYVIDENKYDDGDLFGGNYTAMDYFYNVQHDLYLLYTIPLDLNSPITKWGDIEPLDKNKTITLNLDTYQELQLYARRAMELYYLEGTLQHAGAKTFDELK